MTLFEALAALVILGVTALGFLSLMEGSAAAAQRADVSSQLVAYTESSMNEASARRGDDLSPLPAGFTRHVQLRPWRAGLAELTISVRNVDGDSVVLHRVVRGR